MGWRAELGHGRNRKSETFPPPFPWWRPPDTDARGDGNGIRGHRDLGTLHPHGNHPRDDLTQAERSWRHLAALIEPGGDLITRAEAVGGFSLVFWALDLLTIKYDLIIMRADNRGEGELSPCGPCSRGNRKGGWDHTPGLPRGRRRGTARRRRGHHAADQYARRLRTARRALGGRRDSPRASSSSSSLSGGGQAGSEVSSAGS